MYGQYKSANLGGCKETIRAVINKQIMATEQIRLVDGTIVRKCPTIKPLYCSRAGKFYSVHNAILTDDGWVMREIKPNYTPGMANHKGGSCYPKMRNIAGKDCHHLMWETWVGPRTKGMEIDHINGNMMDWSLSNLEEVTPEENRKRAKILRVLRSIGREPREMSREELLNIFKRYEFEDPAKRMEYEMSHHREI